ncbi:hypothetical protein YC2023_055097 [Brassica napus]
MRSSLPIPEDLVLEVAVKGHSEMSLHIQALGLLFAFQDDSEVVFFSSPQPENPEENSYVVAPIERIFEGMKDSEYVPVICNPSTGQSLNLPTLKSSKRFGVESYLGYDPVSKEFKVLSMETSFVSGQYLSVKHQVLTLGTEKLSWRMVECCIPHNSSRKWICISGVLYYTATEGYWSSMVVCFDLNSEKFTFENFMKASGKEMHGSTTLINYNGKLGLLMSEDTSSDYICGASKSLKLWVLRDAGKNEWSEHVYTYYRLLGRM